LANSCYVAIIKVFTMQKGNNINSFEQKFWECDDKFNTIFKLTSAASKIIGSDLTILKVNQALADLLGYSAEEIEGTKILDYACEEYKAHWYELQNELWSRKVPFFKLQACLYKKDLSLIWVNVMTILFNDEGETFGFTVLDDITAMKHLEESQRRLDIALKYSKIAIWELNLANNNVFRSESHDELFGYTQRQENWTMESYFPHIWEQDLPRFKAAIRSVAVDTVIDLQMRLITKDGSLKWVNFQGRTETDSEGKPSSILGVINDITRDKLIESHKDDFISIASHELKTPITSLKTSLQLLDRMKQGLAEKHLVMIKQANKSINKIVLLVDDLLNASKSYKEQLELKKTMFNVYQVIKESCEQLGVSASHEITIEGPRDIEILADAERIERVLINLLSNSVKYAPDSKELKIQIQRDSDMVRISVTDHGPGIPPEKIRLLFDRYYQANSHEGNYSGLGLGLYISSEIIKKHGGEINVYSEPSKGTTFWFTLPY
jgi:PAS domain S-box-containing protein